MKSINQILYSLSLSKFRSSFHLSVNDFSYITEKGLVVIQKHAYDFLKKRLAPAYIPNDGHQTPRKGHPVFVAMHATATCCRGCLNKWYKIPKDRWLTNDELNYLVMVILAWIKKELEIRKKM